MWAELVTTFCVGLAVGRNWDAVVDLPSTVYDVLPIAWRITRLVTSAARMTTRRWCTVAYEAWYGPPLVAMTPPATTGMRLPSRFAPAAFQAAAAASAVTSSKDTNTHNTTQLGR